MNRELGGEGREETDRQATPTPESKKYKPSILDEVSFHLAKVDAFVARAELLKAERQSSESDSARIEEIGAKLGVPLDQSIDEKKKALEHTAGEIARVEAQVAREQKAVAGVADSGSEIPATVEVEEGRVTIQESQEVPVASSEETVPESEILSSVEARPSENLGSDTPQSAEALPVASDVPSGEETTLEGKTSVPEDEVVPDEPIREETVNIDEENVAVTVDDGKNAEVITAINDEASLNETPAPADRESAIERTENDPVEGWEFIHETLERAEAEETSPEKWMTDLLVAIMASENYGGSGESLSLNESIDRLLEDRERALGEKVDKAASFEELNDVLKNEGTIINSKGEKPWVFKSEELIATITEAGRTGDSRDVPEVAGIRKRVDVLNERR